MWKIVVPPRVHIFLCLLANNKTQTRDNLAKRKSLDDKSCLFCSELESAKHLFFECCVAQDVWVYISEITNVRLGADFELVAKFWIHEKNEMSRISGQIKSAALWEIWKSRNDLCFHNA
jgi:hypothetical protein